MSDDARALLTLIGLAMAYFAPAIVAFRNGKRDRQAILALDLFLGWTMIGWVAALVWALRPDAPPQPSGRP